MVALNIATKGFTDLDCSICKEVKVADRQLTEILRYPDRSHQLIVEHKKEGVIKLYTFNKEVYIKPNEDGSIESIAVVNISQCHSKFESVILDYANMIYGGINLLIDLLTKSSRDKLDECKLEFIIEELSNICNELKETYVEDN